VSQIYLQEDDMDEYSKDLCKIVGRFRRGEIDSEKFQVKLLLLRENELKRLLEQQNRPHETPLAGR
jgi:hypothetical protein